MCVHVILWVFKEDERERESLFGIQTASLLGPFLALVIQRHCFTFKSVIIHVYNIIYFDYTFVAVNSNSPAVLSKKATGYHH